MSVFEANMPDAVCNYFRKLLKDPSGYKATNQKLYAEFGIIDFFASGREQSDLKARLDADRAIDGRNKMEYGDFQTNAELSNRIVFTISKEFRPDTVIEPTCGRGNFLLASLQHFDRLQQLIGIEIYQPYLWETKFNIIEHYLRYPKANKPDIQLFHSSIFDVDLKKLDVRGELLVLGNPPWVTNAKLGLLRSSNLPGKSNVKNLNGFDAITGKGNFDIGEYITLMMFDAFQHLSGRLVFLVKNSVIKNVVFDQKARKYNIGDLRRYAIDSKSEFNVSVEASLFSCVFNQDPTEVCTEYASLGTECPFNHFGWIRDKFVSSIDKYQRAGDIDGESPLVWRSGMKHDCSPVMELKRVNGHFINGKGQPIKLEEDLVYGLLKSSDLKKPVIGSARKQTIVTQKKIGQDTAYIRERLLLTYAYLDANREALDARGSSIYKGKPDFSIFGVGDYSFKPYKVGISSLYKNYDFALVMPEKQRPLMLDDTCYFLGFDRMADAVYAFIPLNSERVKTLLKAISFCDAKRIFTKDILMRIDLKRLAERTPLQEIETALENFNNENAAHITLDHWAEFVESLQGRQRDLFRAG